MEKRGITRLAALAVVCGAPALVAACSSGVTYGTGTTTEMQTLQDISGILSLTGGKKPEIDKSPRGGIVAPPSTAAADLPPPVDETTTASIDWPDDPDEARRRRQAEEDNAPVEQGSLATVRDPGFRLPKEAFKEQKETEANWDYGRQGPNPKFAGGNGKKYVSEMKAERGGSVDAQGNPTRRFLVEPPAEYRVPDPSAPVDPTPPPEQKKSFKLSDLWPF
jgi:hypothetical protein